MSHPTSTRANPAPAKRALPPLDPAIGLMCIAADQLIPLFKTGSIDTGLAREMAVSAIEAYHPETRADYVNVARTIAFSMAALALLGQAASQDFTMSEKMRAFGRANALNRSADQSERSMMQRRRYQLANPPAEPPDHATDILQPNPAMPNPEDVRMQAAIADAMQEYLATCQPSGTDVAAPETAPAPGASSQPPMSATPVTSPIPQSARSTSAVQSPIPPYRQRLLHQTAIHRVVDPTAAHHPG